MRFDVFAAPIEERGHRTDLHRVEMDVADKHQQILVSFHQLALVAPTQQMPLPPVFLTEIDRIAGVELLHERGQVGPSRFTRQPSIINQGLTPTVLDPYSARQPLIINQGLTPISALIKA